MSFCVCLSVCLPKGNWMGWHSYWNSVQRTHRSSTSLDTQLEVYLRDRTWQNSDTDRSPKEKPENWKGKANYLTLRSSRKRPVIERPRNMTYNANELTNSHDNKPENKESFNPSWLVKYKFLVCLQPACLSLYLQALAHATYHKNGKEKCNEEDKWSVTVWTSRGHKEKLFSCIETYCSGKRKRERKDANLMFLQIVIGPR